jgi:hypothetical protein
VASSPLHIVSLFLPVRRYNAPLSCHFSARKSLLFADLLDRLTQELEETSSDADLSRRVRRLSMMMGLAGAQLETRGGELDGRLVLRQSHPKLVPLLVRFAKSTDPDTRQAAYGALAWLFDAYHCKQYPVL